VLTCHPRPVPDVPLHWIRYPMENAHMAAPITREKLASVFDAAQDQDPLRKHLNPLLACGPAVIHPRPSLP